MKIAYLIPFFKKQSLSFLIRCRMSPVVVLDVSKGEIQVQAFLEKGKPYRKSFKVKHDLDGLSQLVDFLEEIKAETGQKPPIILE